MRSARSRLRHRLGRGSLILLLCGVALAIPAQGSSEDDLDDLMGGFDDDFDATEVVGQSDEMPDWLASLPFGELIYERVDLNGSIAAGAVYNYLDHSVRHGDEPGRRTAWGILSRLDLDGFLQLDIALPHEWQLRAEVFAWYDFAYRIQGRGKFGGAVLDVYEWQVDSGEVYVAGPLTDHVDLTIGRKIVNWGRSDTFRIVDVVNPLDNKEPGLVDIEDLRRPRAMVKLDAVSGPWSATVLVIPEHRYDRLPPPGSDFFPDLATVPPFFSNTRLEDRDDFKSTPDFAAKLGGRFSGWDFTLYGAYVDETARVLTLSTSGLRSQPNRFGLAGAAGNYAFSSWLFKIESAFLTDLQVLRARGPVLENDDANRIDTMIGVEYYGPDSLVIALEIVNRHFLEYSSTIIGANSQTEQSRFETAFRISRPFFRERLDVTLLGLAIGERFQGGGLVRLSGDFELTDSWQLTSGALMFIGGSDDGLGLFESNDRVFAEIKYSF